MSRARNEEHLVQEGFNWRCPVSENRRYPKRTQEKEITTHRMRPRMPCFVKEDALPWGRNVSGLIYGGVASRSRIIENAWPNPRQRKTDKRGKVWNRQHWWIEVRSHSRNEKWKPNDGRKDSLSVAESEYNDFDEIFLMGLLCQVVSSACVRILILRMKTGNIGNVSCSVSLSPFHIARKSYRDEE